MLNGKKIGFIGAGQMFEAIVSGALSSGAISAENVFITDVSAERLQLMATTYGLGTYPAGEKNNGAKQLIENCDIVVLAIKPQYTPALMDDIKDCFTANTLVISIVGGITLDTLQGWMPKSPVIRVMPNTPMLVGKGAAGICGGKLVTSANMAECTALFDAVGKSYIIPETLINPLTSVSGCGPAFICLFMEALADGGVEQGLPRAMALELAADALIGTAELMLHTGQHPGQLKDNVCSPGGGTIVGVHALEDGAFRSTVMNAVQRSRRRMDELGED